MRPLLCAVLGACCAVAIACGGSRVKSAAAPPTAADPSGAVDPRAQDPRAQSTRAQIEALDRQIADELARAQLPPPAATCSGAACTQAMGQPFVTPTRDDPQCRPANTPTCTDTCTLATSICNNQQKICDLAQQLAGDDWAAGKCESARASCKAAHEKCCGCLV